MKEKLLKIIDILKINLKKISIKIKKSLKNISTKIKKTIEKTNKKIKKFVKEIKKSFKNKKNNKNASNKVKNKIDYKSFSVKEIETELNRTKYNQKYMKILRSTIYSLIIIASIATIIATLIMPVFEVNSNSMSNTYNQGDIVASIKTKKINQGDVIAFYHGNKILVKRVIATSGSWVVINEDGNIYVDGSLIDEPYIENKEPFEYNIEFPYQVPDSSYFVLSDIRKDMIDSRNKEIGSISQSDVIGKILFRIWPLKK